MRTSLLLLLLMGVNTAAETEIFRCTQDDGTVAFQELPCPEDTELPSQQSEATPAAEDEFFDFVNPFDNPDVEVVAQEPAPPEPTSGDRAECEKAARDAIDAIDLEMRSRSYSREEGQAYLADLRQLTRQLRACKQL